MHMISMNYLFPCRHLQSYTLLLLQKTYIHKKSTPREIPSKFPLTKPIKALPHTPATKYIKPRRHQLTLRVKYS